MISFLPVWPRRRETTCSIPVLPHRPRPFFLPSWQLSNRRYATTQRRPGGATSTSLWLTQMDPALSTLSTSFLHSFRYNKSILDCLLQKQTHWVIRLNDHTHSFFFFPVAVYSKEVLLPDLWCCELSRRRAERVGLKTSEVFSDAGIMLGMPDTLYWCRHGERLSIFQLMQALRFQQRCLTSTLIFIDYVLWTPGKNEIQCAGTSRVPWYL